MSVMTRREGESPSEVWRPQTLTTNFPQVGHTERRGEMLFLLRFMSFFQDYGPASERIPPLKLL